MLGVVAIFTTGMRAADESGVDTNLSSAQQNMDYSQVQWNNIGEFCNEIQEWDTSKIVEEAKIADIQLCRNTQVALNVAVSSLTSAKTKKINFQHEYKYKAAIITTSIGSLLLLLEGGGSLVSKSGNGAIKVGKNGYQLTKSGVKFLKGKLDNIARNRHTTMDIELGHNADDSYSVTSSIHSGLPPQPPPIYSPLGNG